METASDPNQSTYQLNEILKTTDLTVYEMRKRIICMTQQLLGPSKTTQCFRCSSVQHVQVPFPSKATEEMTPGYDSFRSRSSTVCGIGFLAV